MQVLERGESLEMNHGIRLEKKTGLGKDGC